MYKIFESNKWDVNRKLTFFLYLLWTQENVSKWWCESPAIFSLGGYRNFLIEIMLKTKPPQSQYNFSYSAYWYWRRHAQQTWWQGSYRPRIQMISFPPFLWQLLINSFNKIKMSFGLRYITNEVALFVDWEITIVEFISMLYAHPILGE